MASKATSLAEELARQQFEEDTDGYVELPRDVLVDRCKDAINEALEAAAKIADDYDFEGTACSDRIRALKSL